jgi:hypothetical protein
MTREKLDQILNAHVSMLRKQVAEAGTFSGPCPEDWAVGQEIARQFPAVALAAATELCCQYHGDDDEFWGTRRGKTLTMWVRSSFAVGSDPLPRVREMFPDSEWGYAPCEGAVPKGVKSLWVFDMASIWRR